MTLSQQLSWSHFHALLPIKDPLVRDFYAERCRIERWDVQTLRQKIGSMLFQRTALSKRPKAVISAEIGKLRDVRVRLVAAGQDSPASGSGRRYLTFAGCTAERPVYLKTCRTKTNRRRPGLGLSG